MRMTQYALRPQPSSVVHFPESVFERLATRKAARVSSSSSRRSTQSRSSMRSCLSSGVLPRRRRFRAARPVRSKMLLPAAAVACARCFVSARCCCVMSSDCAALSRCFWSRSTSFVTGRSSGSRQEMGKLTAPKPLRMAMQATPKTARRDTSSVMRSAPPEGRSAISAARVRRSSMSRPCVSFWCNSLMGSVRRPIQNAVRKLQVQMDARMAENCTLNRRRRKL
mmetsp:Transcript_5087/g.14414  ORF Transcript_5087/g.14414 Transcript_5087/m.14414 type:complete len:224 (+) Transcript_5087:96-767(+)